jgi:hypothetical protein
MSLKYINQSLVKQSEKKEFCPRAYYSIEILGEFQKAESLPMTQGKYFEYLATGAKDRDGSIAELNSTLKGKPTVSQLRIEWQAKQFKSNLEKHNIEIVSVGNKLSFNLFDEFLTTGIEDAEVLYQGEPAIMDIKLTGDINNTFGDFSWGDFQGMDKLQAYTYTLLKYHLTKKRYRFIYYIADHKKNPEYKIEEVSDPLGRYQEVYNRFKNAFMRMTAFEKLGYPAVPSENCKNCAVTSCQFNGVKQKFSNQVIDLETVQAELKKIEQAKKISEIKSRFAGFQKKKAKEISNDYNINYE